jgi:hypothetical protein
MLLNLGLNRLAPSLDPSLRKAPNIVAAPKSNIDINAILGLAPSQYEGLQSVGDTGYYYGNNRMYEPYTVTSSPSYGIHGPYGNTGYSYSPYGGSPYNPYAGAYQSNSNSAEGTITVGSQAFRPVDADITGFSKSKIGDTETYEYSPSMAYVYANTPRPAPLPTPNVTSFLSTPTAMATPTGNYGAGRFLGNTGGGLLNFSAPQVAATTQGTK